MDVVPVAVHFHYNYNAFMWTVSVKAVHIELKYTRTHESTHARTHNHVTCQPAVAVGAMYSSMAILPVYHVTIASHDETYPIEL